MSWRTTTWGEVIRLHYGKALVGGSVDSGPVRVYGTNGPTGFTDAEPQGTGPSVVVGRKGAYRGIHYAPEPFFVIDTAFYVESLEGVDMRWVYYALKTVDLDAIATGSAIPSTRREDLYEVKVRLPPRREQQAIAEVLGALDDKIAANFGTSECAEHLQSALWKKARSQVSLQPLSRFVTPKLGGTPPRADATSWEGTVPWASVRDMTSAPGRVILTTAENISHEASESAPRLQAHPVGSVFMSARGTVGHVTTNAVPCAINQSAYAFTPLEKYRVSCRLALQDAVATLRAHAHGSVFNTITTKNLTGLVIPDLESSAIAEAEPDLARLEALRIAALSENTTLTAVRDELLPQLMSGRITVKDAEKRVQEEV